MKTVLIVDDVVDTIIALRDRLEFAGYAVETATHGAEALELAKKEKIDLILLDVMMPGDDGFTVCGKLKEMRETKDIPVIMLTAKSLLGDVEKALDMGAVSYIVKPFEADDLLAKIKRYIK